MTAPKARRGERVDASADLSAACSAPGRVAAMPQRLRPAPRDRLQARPTSLRGPAAQLCADSVLVSSRRGIDADEPAAAARLEAIRTACAGAVARADGGAQRRPGDLSPSTIYRWVSAGYDGMTNMELRRKVGYRHEEARRVPMATRHPPAGRMPRSPRGGRAAAWEMDTVEGARE